MLRCYAFKMLSLLLVICCMKVSHVVSETSFHKMQKELSNIEKDLGYIRELFKKDEPKSDCDALFEMGERVSGLYFVQASSKMVQVYCEFNDTKTRKNWMIIQRRFNGEEDFYRNWDDYKKGFGNLMSEFWLGLDNMHYITSDKSYILHIDLEDFFDNKVSVEYSTFEVGSESTKYKLSVGGFSGNGGDSLSYHDGHPFSTFDKDNDNWFDNCAEARHGGWWYNRCCYANLNGQYFPHKVTTYHAALWYMWKNSAESLKTIVMKLRPLN